MLVICRMPSPLVLTSIIIKILPPPGVHLNQLSLHPLQAPFYHYFLLSTSLYTAFIISHRGPQLLLPLEHQSSPFPKGNELMFLFFKRMNCCFSFIHSCIMLENKQVFQEKRDVIYFFITITNRLQIWASSQC